ncbi:MAG: hypothetical protein M3N08_03830 [Pseudomonadota bacterium]|nr:hypothetical protein [Pseudomonadota bacterium]
MTFSVKKTITDFRHQARVISETSSGFMRQYGANVAGGFGLLAAGAQFYLAHQSPCSGEAEVAAGLNMLSPLTNFAFGRWDAGIVTASLFGTVGFLMTVGPKILEGDHTVFAGFGIAAAAQTINLLSAPLTKKFENSKHAILRRTLGRPRRLAGGAFTISRLPVIASALAAHRPELYIPFMILGLGGDPSSMWSCSETSQLRQQRPQSTHRPSHGSMEPA